jgi:hypothetical protein
MLFCTPNIIRLFSSEADILICQIFINRIWILKMNSLMHLVRNILSIYIPKLDSWIHGLNSVMSKPLRQTYYYQKFEVVY